MMTEKEELEFLRAFLVRHFSLNQELDEDFPNVLTFDYASGQSEYHELKLDDRGDPQFQTKLLWAYRNGCDDPEKFERDVLAALENIKNNRASKKTSL